MGAEVSMDIYTDTWMISIYSELTHQMLSLCRPAILKSRARDPMQNVYDQWQENAFPWQHQLHLLAASWPWWLLDSDWLKEVHCRYWWYGKTLSCEPSDFHFRVDLMTNILYIFPFNKLEAKLYELAIHAWVMLAITCNMIITCVTIATTGGQLFLRTDQAKSPCK